MFENTRSNANTLWSLYQKCYGPNGEFLDKAECVNCSKHFAYKGNDYVGSLWRHLRNAHGIEREYTDSHPVKKTAKRIVVPPPKINILRTPTNSRKRKSQEQPVKKTVKRTVMPAPTVDIFATPAKTIKSANVSVYRYFTLYKGGKAKCRVCMSAGLPTPLLTSTVKDMLSHLKTHPRAFKLYELEENYGKRGPEFDERIHLPENSTTSGLLAQTSDGKYHCQFCQIIVSKSTEMQKHLKEKHAITEFDIGNDIIYTEVVFVGDKNKQANKQNFSNNPDKDSKAAKNNFEYQDVDAFGKYVTTLLKSMPKDDSTKLQQTILNKIIEAKLKTNQESSKNQDEVDSAGTIIAVVENDDGNDYTDTGDTIEEVVMIEEHLEPIYEDVENIEDVEENEPDHKRFKYEMELS